jgi:uncharacterized protein YeaO (DUF488 family)
LTRRGAGQIAVGRVYDEAARAGAAQILVDRLWPRGLRREDAHIDEWLKDVAPSTELRRWYGHDPDRFPEFARRYRAELDDADHAEAVRHVRELARNGPVMLLTATKDVEISAARVLADLLTA